ncbi:MAG: amidase [Alphaproteobacteria bacterium]|jgi:aspartyl-tRNA(Asn)/glutamyl-tRNA(Gln) amidotransferase subunit A|nr:amidase [Alphaproteobacteria bacterium]
MDATALVKSYAAQDITPDAALTEALARIDRLDGGLGCYSARNADAQAQARAATERWAAGQPRGPLDGVPMIVKDNLCAAGMPAAWGNSELARRRVTTDELPVARLRAAGAILLGKGNCPEFAVEGYTDNLTFGPTRNPFDPALTPGGSSGGVVAAVAAGLATLGLGTDGGGSIRRPAGYTGLVGLKPGLGRVPRAGGLAQVLLDFEVAGPIARSARDARLAFDVLDEAPCDPAILSATRAVADRLAGMGCHVTEGTLPLDLSPLSAVWGRVAEIGLARYLGSDTAVADAAAPKYREMAARGAVSTGPELWAILDIVRDLRNAAAQFFDQIDLVLMPSSAAMPWPATEAFPPVIDGQPVGPRGHAVYTGWVNAAGLPAIGLPAPSDDLPIGVQLIGDMGSEEILLDLAERLEAAHGGFQWPAMAQDGA